MAIDRRSFIAGVAGMLTCPARTQSHEAVRRSVIAATVRQRDGSFAAVIYELGKGALAKADLPGRGHDVTVNPATGECVAFARRPGTFAIAFGVDRQRPPVAFSSPQRRHFYGHGVFSRDGRLLYTTENDFPMSVGRIGVWDVVAGYRRIGEFSSAGIGPHDINVMPDGETLVIANGGVATHPEHGRRPLNLPSMRPNLAYVDRANGNLIERHELPESQSRLSIRHLDVAADGTVVFGCQHKGARHMPVDLIGFHRIGETPGLLQGGASVRRALRHYVSSVAVDRTGEFAAVTSSRGQQVVVVDVAKRRVVDQRRFSDVSGVAAGGDGTSYGFVLTGGGGDLAIAGNGSGLVHQQKADWAWDNHATAIAG